MAEKQKKAKKARKHKESKHQHGSGGKVTHEVLVDFKVRDKAGRVVHTEKRRVNRDGLGEIQKYLIVRNYAGKRRAAVLPKAARGRA